MLVLDKIERLGKYLIAFLIIIQIFSANSFLTTSLYVFRVSNIEDRESRFLTLLNETRDPYFSQFIAKHSPEDASILVGNKWLQDSINSRYTFPRIFIYFQDWLNCDAYPTIVTYIAISVFDSFNLTDICIEYTQIYTLDYATLDLDLADLDPNDAPHQSLLVKIR